MAKLSGTEPPADFETGAEFRSRMRDALSKSGLPKEAKDEFRRQASKIRKQQNRERAARQVADRIGCTATDASKRERDWPQEEWADKTTANVRFGRPEPQWSKRIDECAEILRTRHALQAMPSYSLSVIVALLGDMPPNLPAEGLWSKSLDMEYRRVVRYAVTPSSGDAEDVAVSWHGGGGADLESFLFYDKHARDGERPEETRKRLAGYEVGRKSKLTELGKRCERLIVAATNDFLAALRSQPAVKPREAVREWWAIGR